jgi:hypothetical protein
MQLLTSKTGLAAMSELGTFRTWDHVRPESVIGTKADVRRTLQVYGFHALNPGAAVGQVRLSFDASEREAQNRLARGGNILSWI